MFKPAAEIFYMKQAEESSSEDKDETGLFFGYIHLFVLLNMPLKLPEV